MTTLQIVLIVIGLVCLVGSFFVSEKLSTSDLEEMQKMSEQELKIILDKEMKNASDKIEDSIQEKMDELLADMERKSDKETNDKIMAIGDYSDTVLNSMNKSHDEIVFMYDMLNDKQQKVTELTKEMQVMQSAITEMEKLLDAKIEEVQALVEKSVEFSKEQMYIEEEPEETMEEAFQSHALENVDESTFAKDNEQILALYREGVDEVEIAKQLGRGLGEVKLVLGLFSEGAKS